LLIVLIWVAVTPSAILAADKKGVGGQTENQHGKFELPSEKSQPLVLPRFASAPVIDGKLDDEIWKSAAVLKDFYQTQPGDNIPPSEPTEVLIGYDAKNLYLAFRCFDEADKVRATVAKRDAIFDDDNVGVLLDTFNDKRKAYEFFYNPLG